MRALWVHGRDIVDQADADAVIAVCQNAHIEDILFQIMDDYGRALYNNPSPFTKSPAVGDFDPLGYLVASGMRTHAWLCVGRDPLYVYPAWDTHVTQGIAETYPSWADLSKSYVRDFVAAWCAAIVASYPTVGIHLDYIRWDVSYGGDGLPFATQAAITQTVQAIAAAIPAGTPFSCAVTDDPSGTMYGSQQKWADWPSLVDYFAVMAYPSYVASLATLMNRALTGCARNQIVVGLSGMYYTYNPYEAHTLDDSLLNEFIVWCATNRFTHIAWFDYTKITAHQFDIIKQQTIGDDGTTDPIIRTFESGNLSGTADSFDAAVTNGGNLTASAAAALNGSKYGVRCYMPNTGVQYGGITLSSVKRYRILAWFDPNSVVFPTGGVLSSVVLYGTVGVPIARWKLYYTGGQFYVRLAARTDAGTDVASTDLAITDAPHKIEMDFFIGSAGENNGFLVLWVDETNYKIITEIDNDTMNVNECRVGAPLGPDSGTSGAVYFDGIRINYSGSPIREVSVVKRLAGSQLAVRHLQGSSSARKIW